MFVSGFVPRLCLLGQSRGSRGKQNYTNQRSSPPGILHTINTPATGINPIEVQPQVHTRPWPPPPLTDTSTTFFSTFDRSNHKINSAGAGNAASFQGKADRHAERAAGHPPRALPAARRQHTASRGPDEDGERRGHVSHGVPGERREGAASGGGRHRLA